MKKMIFAAVLAASVSAQAQNPSLAEKAKILDCMEPVFLNDPNFQQGSEKYFDVLVVDGKFEVKFTAGDLKSETILKSEANTGGYMSLEEGAFYSTWQAPGKVALVLRDFGNRWRGSLMFPEGYQSETLNMTAGSEVDLACILK